MLRSNSDLEERRPANVVHRFDQAGDGIEIGRCRSPPIVDRTRHCDQVDDLDRGSLAADAVVHAVVEEHMAEIARGVVADDGHRAEVHQCRAVAVEAPDRALGSRRAHTQGRSNRVTHSSDGQEVEFAAGPSTCETRRARGSAFQWSTRPRPSGSASIVASSAASASR